MASTREFQSRHVFCVLALVMCRLLLMGVTCQNINGTLLSCYKHCGNKRLVPCSCDVTCTLLNKCCEDFADHCPLVFTQSMESFPQLMNATIMCSKYSFFTIMSCPQEFKHSQINENNQSYTQVDGSQSLNLLDIVNNAPVADLSTGLVFLNSEIYSCNGANESQKTHFEVEIAMKSDGIPTSYLNFNEVLKLQTAFYIPSSGVLPLIANSACLRENEMTSKCKDGIVGLNITADTVDQCENGSFSYVKSRKSLGKLYKNRYCLFCNRGQAEIYEAVDQWKQVRNDWRFSVIPSLVMDGSALNIVLQGDKSLSAWKEMECDTQINDQSPHSTSCNVKQCGNDYQLRPDGQCVLLHDALIGISDDGYDFSKAEERHLPDLISCFLQEHFDLDVVYMDPNISHICDDRLKQAIYFVTGRMALKYRSRNIFNVATETQDTIKFSAVVKALVRHRRMKFLNERNDNCRVYTSPCYQGEDGDLALGCRAIDEGNSTIPRFTSSTFSVANSMKYVGLRGTIVDNKTTTICLSSWYNDRFLVNRDCLKEPVYENDLNLINNYMESKCFSLLETNRACSLGVSMWLPEGWVFCVGLNIVRLVICDFY